MNERLLKRRAVLQGACGFGALALGGSHALASGPDLLAPKPPMFLPRAKRVIFIFMQGGPSHVDTFDYKPELIQRDGQSIGFTGVRFGTFGKKSNRRLMKPLWKFQQHGESGHWVSELFPHQAAIVDDLCFIHSMQTEGVAHGPATLFLHTGATNLVRPSMGSWISYGLGTESPDLPAFVSLLPSDTKGGPRNYASAFLPAVHQGTALGRAGQPASEATVRHLTGASSEQYALQATLNQLQAAGHTYDGRMQAELVSFELAQRMQHVAPDLLDLSSEPASMRALYGLDEEPTDEFARQCLLARRLTEAGVRFVQINYGDESPNPRWDQHADMPQHAKHARATDKPVAGLIRDLKARGLLEDTLVWWGGEFGRTPFAQGKDGRDHNPRGFTVWLAGGGVKAGHTHGATDELGHLAVQDPVHMHDLHATILHLLGLDHERLTHKWSGRDFRLTDVHGKVVHELFA
jgi:hypothetical protein